MVVLGLLGLLALLLMQALPNSAVQAGGNPAAMEEEGVNDNARAPPRPGTSRPWSRHLDGRLLLLTCGAAVSLATAAAATLLCAVW